VTLIAAFYRATALFCAERAICHRPSLRVSVQVFVKRLKLGLRNFLSPYSSPSLYMYFCGISFIQKFWRPGSPSLPSNKGGVTKTSYFLALCVSISKTVGDTFKLSAND